MGVARPSSEPGDGTDPEAPGGPPLEPSPHPAFAAFSQRPVVVVAAIVVGAVVIGVVLGFLLGRAGNGSSEDDALLFGEGDDDSTDGDGGRPPPMLDDPPTSTAPEDAAEPEGDADQATPEPRAPECPPEEGAEPDGRHMWWTEAPPMCIDPDEIYTATLETDRGDIVISLDTEEAPTTVNNFVFLARWGFYDGMDFNAVIPGASVTTGEAPEDGPPGYTFEGELPTEEPYYPLHSVAMGISGEPGVHDSVFYIVTGAGSQTPPDYSRFGYVTRGQAVVDEIDATGVRRAGTDRTPRERTVIESVTVEER